MTFLDISITGWVALSIAISMAFLAGLVFVLGKERFQYVWGVFCIAIAVWAAGFYMVTLATSTSDARFWWQISYIGTIMNPFLYFHFTLEFVKNKLYQRHKMLILGALYTVAYAFVYLNLTTHLIVDRVTFLFGSMYYDTPPGALYLYFMSLFLALIVWSLYLIAREYRAHPENSLFRQRALYFFIASAIAYVGGSLNFMPVYGIEVNPATNFAVAFGAVFIAYAILRRGLFDIKVVVAQIMTLTLAVLMLVRLLVSSSAPEAFFNTLMLALTLVIGVYLIKSVRQEIELREHVQSLVGELRETNERQEGLIHFIGHEVKGFLTKAQGVFSLLNDGELGPLSGDMKPFVERALKDTQDGVASVSDILKAANLKRGTVTFKKEPFDLKALAATAVEDAQPLAKEKGLTLSFVPSDGDFAMIGDGEELRSHVLRNLIENAIYYTPQGSVTVSLEKGKDANVFTVKDTGVGITDEDKQKLFTEGGHGKDSIKVNAHSTGYGLYIAKQVVEAHGGTVRAESDGPGTGSSFIVELPGPIAGVA